MSAPNYPNLRVTREHAADCAVNAPEDADTHLDAQNEDLVCTCLVFDCFCSSPDCRCGRRRT